MNCEVSPLHYDTILTYPIRPWRVPVYIYHEEIWEYPDLTHDNTAIPGSVEQARHQLVKAATVATILNGLMKQRHKDHLADQVGDYRLQIALYDMLPNK